jgi:hypothetical protein
MLVLCQQGNSENVNIWQKGLMDADLFTNSLTTAVVIGVSYLDEVWSADPGQEYTVAGVLDEPYSPLIPLSRVAVQARQATYACWNRVHCPMSNLRSLAVTSPLSWLS